LITCIFALPRSKWLKRTPRPRAWKTTKPDGDKIDRLVMDTLEGVVYVRDQQVVRHSLQKISGTQGEPARTVIAAGPEEDSTQVTCARCGRHGEVRAFYLRLLERIRHRA
jgi:Endodeoxyribonuclease RusA